MKKAKHKYYLVKFQYKDQTGYETLAKGYVPTAVYLTDNWTYSIDSDILITDSTDIDITEKTGFDDKEFVNLVSNNTMYLPNNQKSFIVVFKRTAKKPATYKPIAISEKDPTFDTMVHINKYKYTPSTELAFLTDKDHDNSVHYKQYEPPIDTHFGISGNGGTLGGKRTRPRYSRKRIKQYRKKSRSKKVY